MMRNKAPSLLALLASLAVLLGGWTLAAAAPARNWNAVVTVGAKDSHVLGNPQAAIRLTEYVSYTCAHCARFEQEADAPLRIGHVASGKLAVEVRHFVRDPIDMTVALLAQCGPADKFFLNHAAFMRSQETWMKRLADAGQTQRTRWSTGAFAARTRAIARDLGFHEIMRTRGYTNAQVDACLADEALAKRLASGTAAARDKLGIAGTPSFLINGVLLAGTHDWETLRPQLDARR